MRAYNPEKNKNIDVKEVVADYFDTDRFTEDAFFVFKRELIDYFTFNKEAKAMHRTYWLLSVHAYWSNLWRISTEETLVNLVDQIPDASRLGFDVFKEFIYYIRKKFFKETEMQEYYSKLREQIINSEVPVGLNNSEKTLSILWKDIELLNSYSDDTMRTAEFFDKLQHLLFRNADDGLVSQYVAIDPAEATKNLVKLFNFIINTEPKYIWPASEAEEFYFTVHLDPSEVPAQIGVPPQDLEEVLAMPAIQEVKVELPEELKKAKEITSNEVTVEDLYKEYDVNPTASGVKIEVQTNQINNKTETQPSDIQNKQVPAGEAAAKPSYAEIKEKVDSAFPKDKSGVYKDLDGVLMALQKAADKYSDPKIAELYFFDEQEEKFKWNI